MPTPAGPSLPPSHQIDLHVRGAVPQGLAGVLAGVGSDGVVRAIQLRPGAAASYRERAIHPSASGHGLAAFNGCVLIVADGAPAVELSPALDASRDVDLAGRRRSLAACPRHDPITGDLHVIADAVGSAPTHAVISAGALTRRTRSIADVPGRITDLALTRDRLVYVADGHIGVASRDGEQPPTWIATGAVGVTAIHAHDAGDAVELLVLTPALERWSLHAAAGRIERTILDPTARRFAHLRGDHVDGPPPALWTTGSTTIGHHHLGRSRHVHHDVSPGSPGDFAVVADGTRASHAEGAWLVLLVHDAAAATAEVRIVDANAIDAPAVATVLIPRHIPRSFCGAWIPSSHQ